MTLRSSKHRYLGQEERRERRLQRRADKRQKAREQNPDGRIQGIEIDTLPSEIAGVARTISRGGELG